MIASTLNGVTVVLPLVALVGVSLLLLHQLDGWIADAVRSDVMAVPAGAMTARELSGLIDVGYGLDDLVIVSPRGVELPYCASWSLDDVMDTLVAVDAL